MARSNAPKEEPQDDHEGPAEPTLKERVEVARYSAYGQHSLVTADGEPDQEALIQKVFDIVSVATVEKPSERSKKAVTRSQFMEQIFPKVTNSGGWVDEDDPELAEELYKRLDTDIWRLLSVAPDGAIQSMLNGEFSMILCRSKQTRTREAHAYVTRNYKCLYEDFSSDVRELLDRAAKRHTALMSLAMTRSPEDAKKFLREFQGNRNVLTSGESVLKSLAAAVANDAIDGKDDDNKDEEKK